MTVRAVAKYRDSSSRTASGSRDSDNVVNPTRSPNSTEVTRRSATRAEAMGCCGMAATEVDAGVPHSAQNFPVIAAPQLEQDVDRGVPHSGQNFAVSEVVAPHSAQDGTWLPLSAEGVDRSEHRWCASALQHFR